jgi:dienelactone hydrolase
MLGLPSDFIRVIRAIRVCLIPTRRFSRYVSIAFAVFGAVGACVCLRSAASEPVAAVAADGAFDPADWLRERKLGRLITRTPQSGKALQPIAARTLAEWKEERKAYLAALRELIGPWSERRPELRARVIEQKDFDKYTRYKVGFRSLAAKAGREAEYASEIRAWLMTPKMSKPPWPAIITLHQTVPQGKDEPAGIKGPHPWMFFATHYAERGYVTLAPDMIGYGERTAGGYERTGFELADAAPILDEHRDMTLLGLMLFDVTRCVDYLESRSDVDRGRIGVIGHSQGGFLVNCVLGLEPRLRVGVASCGYGLFRGDELFPQRWAAHNSAYLPRLHLYEKDANALPIDFLQIMALAAPRAHLVQTAMGDTIWTLPAVKDNDFVIKELRRVRALYGQEPARQLVSVTPADGATDRNHGWYPVGQEAADKLFEKVLRAEGP